MSAYRLAGEMLALSMALALVLILSLMMMLNVLARIVAVKVGEIHIQQVSQAIDILAH